MPWTPESGDPLGVDYISSLGLEEGTMKLWSEFLAGYFDGGSHVVRTDASSQAESKVFPVARLAFQGIGQPQPLNGLGINILTLAWGDTTRRRHRGELWCFNKAVWKFQFRASIKDDTNGQQAANLVRIGSDLFYGLMLVGARREPLRNAGIHNIRPTMPNVLSAGDYKMRVMNVRANLQFGAGEGLEAAA